jgi:hypothetical protein
MKARQCESRVYTTSEWKKIMKTGIFPHVRRCKKNAKYIVGCAAFCTQHAKIFPVHRLVQIKSGDDK